MEDCSGCFFTELSYLIDCSSLFPFPKLKTIRNNGRAELTIVSTNNKSCDNEPSQISHQRTNFYTVKRNTLESQVTHSDCHFENLLNAQTNK